MSLQTDVPFTYSQEKLVVQVSMKKSECILAFAQLGPTYMSPNAEEGRRECELFFSDDYAESLNEEDLGFEGIQAELQENVPADQLSAQEGDLPEGESAEESSMEGEEDEGEDEDEAEADLEDLFGVGKSAVTSSEQI